MMLTYVIHNAVCRKQSGKPMIRPNIKSMGTNCRMVAGWCILLFTKGLNKPYW